MLQKNKNKITISKIMSSFFLINGDCSVIKNVYDSEVENPQ